jgi:hypothetical protein
MRRYYFDLRDNHALVWDDEGVELIGLDAAREEAERSLASAIREAFLNPLEQGEIAIEVRDAKGPVLRVSCLIALEMSRSP